LKNKNYTVDAQLGLASPSQNPPPVRSSMKKARMQKQRW